MKFLETLNCLDQDVLIPINRIKYISYGHKENGAFIKIVTDAGDLEEHFIDLKRADERYKIIKQIVEAE